MQKLLPRRSASQVCLIFIKLVFTIFQLQFICKFIKYCEIIIMPHKEKYYSPYKSQKMVRKINIYKHAPLLLRTKSVPSPLTQIFQFSTFNFKLQRINLLPTIFLSSSCQVPVKFLSSSNLKKNQSAEMTSTD